MGKIKTIIIDDNNSAINDLIAKIKPHTKIKLDGTANSFCEGIKLIKQTNPDLILLDVEMPDKDGFQVVAWIKNNMEIIPHIIFTTGYQDYAVKALKEGALDFLLKPVDEKELDIAIQKAETALDEDLQRKKLETLLTYVSSNKQIFLPSPTGFRSVNTNDIMYVRRNNQTERVELVFGENDKLILQPNYSLAQLQKTLPSADFFQVKRELVINIRYISEIENYTKDCILKKGNFIVKLQMSRRSMKEFKDRMVL